MKKEKEEKLEAVEEKKETSSNLKIILPVLCVALVALAAFISLTLKNKNEENEVEPQDNNVVEPTTEDSNSEFSIGGIYDNLSFILDNVFEHVNKDGIMNIKDALKLNGNILDDKDYKNEFAFQYGAEFGYVDYLGDEYTGETGTYSVTEENYNKLHEMIYGEQGMIDKSIFSDVCYNKESLGENPDLKCLEDPNISYYVSGIFTGYSEEDEFRFKQTSHENLEEDVYRVYATIYDNNHNCLEEHDKDYCTINPIEIGTLMVEYETVENNYVFLSIELLEK